MHVHALAISMLAVLFLSAAPVGAQGPADAAGTRDTGGALRWSEGPSLRVGDALRLDLHARIQSDVRLREPRTGDGRFTWGNRRISLQGALFKRVEFQLERELQDTAPWRDVFADVRLARWFRIRAGRFKVPFSLERTTSSFDLDFISRAAVVTDVSPGRERGVMIHGRAAGRLLEYEAGRFELTPDPDDPLTGDSGNPLTMTAGRLTVAPVRGRDGMVRDVRVGVAVTDNLLPAGMHATAAHFESADVLDAEAFYVNGRRRRFGVEGLSNIGRLSIRGELLRQADSRLGEAVTGGDLSDLVTHGGYLSGVWRVAGTPGRNQRGLDLALRFDRLEFGSSSRRHDQPSISPRSDHVAPVRQDTWTIGATWLASRLLKVQVNGVRAQLIDHLQVRRGSLPVPSWRGLLRVQAAL